MKPSYDFNHPIFKKVPRYRRLAREHLTLAELKSDRVKWRVVKTETVLKIPVAYHIDYHVKSIVGIDQDNAPVYGNKHTVEISFPQDFPKSTFAARTVSRIWHPNIKWDKPNKGHICTNNKKFGKGYTLYMLVLRIGEIIQYKNYLAENVPPYPDDAMVARWVQQYAEPQGLMGGRGKQPVDNSNLLEYTEPPEPERKLKIKRVVRSSSKPINLKRKP